MNGRDLARPPGAPVIWGVSTRIDGARTPPVRTWFEARAWGAVAMGVEPHEVAAILVPTPASMLPAQTRAAFASPVPFSPVVGPA